VIVVKAQNRPPSKHSTKFNRSFYNPHGNQPDMLSSVYL
jgi:hypothetical protein